MKVLDIARYYTREMCVMCMCVGVMYLPTKHQRALGARSKVSVRSKSNWNLEMLGFFGGRKTGEPREKPSEQGREPTTNSTHI